MLIHAWFTSDVVAGSHVVTQEKCLCAVVPTSVRRHSTSVRTMTNTGTVAQTITVTVGIRTGICLVSDKELPVQGHRVKTYKQYKVMLGHVLYSEPNDLKPYVNSEH